jgi:hypothetical protein
VNGSFERLTEADRQAALVWAMRVAVAATTDARCGDRGRAVAYHRGPTA